MFAAQVAVVDQGTVGSGDNITTSGFCFRGYMTCGSSAQSRDEVRIAEPRNTPANGAKSPPNAHAAAATQTSHLRLAQRNRNECPFRVFSKNMPDGLNVTTGGLEG